MTTEPNRSGMRDSRECAAAVADSVPRKGSGTAGRERIVSALSRGNKVTHGFGLCFGWLMGREGTAKINRTKRHTF